MNPRSPGQTSSPQTSVQRVMPSQWGTQNPASLQDSPGVHAT
jgi:hypothetical protein